MRPNWTARRLAATPQASSGELSDLIHGVRVADQSVGARGRVRWRSFRRALIVLSIGLVAMLSGPGAQPMPLRVYLAAGAETFNLVEWEARHLAAHAGTLAAALAHSPAASSGDLELMREYLNSPRGARVDSRWDAERAIERQLSALIDDVGIARLPWLPTPGLFPPVAFRFTSPPSVLVVAPRDRLVVQQSVFLEPGISESQTIGVERRVDNLGLSSLVTPIGGLATYPSMVVESGRATEVLTSVAHEWVHAYLFFSPLGATYWSNQQGRAINETVADIAGKELGAILAERAGIAAPATTARAAPDPVFRREMRATRMEVERLLSMGAIDVAEEYMERRRLELDALGYRIRRLNQAYFAFHGSYAESVAGDSRLGSLVRALRERSPGLAAFITSVATVQSIDDLQRLLNRP
jgi:hypothetical protein